MTTKTDTEQERAAFEAWANGRCELHLVNPAGRYSSVVTQFAWEAYQAGRAALQSQDREDALRYQWLCDKFGITKLPCAIERIIAGDVYVADGKAGIDEAIDHARRIEGEAK